MIREIAPSIDTSADADLSTPIGPLVAEGRVLDAVTGQELRGTLDELAERLEISYDDLRVAIDELAAIGWITVDLLPEGYIVLGLPEDLRFAS